jgi:hypothetical protein
MSENKVKGRVFRTNKDHVMRKWKKLYDEICNFELSFVILSGLFYRGRDLAYPQAQESVNWREWAGFGTLALLKLWIIKQL